MTLNTKPLNPQPLNPKSPKSSDNPSSCKQALSQLSTEHAGEMLESFALFEDLGFRVTV